MQARHHCMGWFLGFLKLGFYSMSIDKHTAVPFLQHLCASTHLWTKVQRNLVPNLFFGNVSWGKKKSQWSRTWKGSIIACHCMSFSWHFVVIHLPPDTTHKGSIFWCVRTDSPISAFNGLVFIGYCLLHHNIAVHTVLPRRADRVWLFHWGSVSS